MALRLMAKKKGMIQIFDEKGNVIVCTVLQAEPNVVTQIKSKESDGYNAVQVGFDTVKVKDPRTAKKRVSKPLQGHYGKNKIALRKHLVETRIDDIENYSIGQEITVGAFSSVEFVDVCGTSKGKGYQGVMKLHNYKGGPASHGTGFRRTAGSTGALTPARCLPGEKRASQMGNRRKTVQNLPVVKIYEDKGVILVKGNVPGANSGLVYITPAIKITPTIKGK